MSNKEQDMLASSRTPEREMRDRTRRAFITMGLATAAGYGGWRWLRTRPEAEGLAGPFRRMLQFNERVAGTYFSRGHLATVYSPSQIQKARINGDVGLGDDFDFRSWSLTLKPLAGSDQPRRLTLADIKNLPKVEHTTQLRCIEGWSVITQWAGARFADFTAAYAPASAKARYVSMQTPDEEYYVGLDMPSALHPQTLLCYEMNGAPLTVKHGSPLRLAIPVKYGIKNIKRISSISYTDERPRDYWAEEGYDWYAGL